MGIKQHILYKYQTETINETTLGEHLKQAVVQLYYVICLREENHPHYNGQFSSSNIANSLHLKRCYWCN